jgi:hypothetical protein
MGSELVAYGHGLTMLEADADLLVNLDFYLDAALTAEAC